MIVDGGIDSSKENDIFRRHYEEDSSDWGKHSGGGSDSYHTIEYRCFLDKFNRMNKVRSIVDIGCGDWQFSQFLNLSGIDYVGLDVVPSVVNRNTEKFSSSSIKFGLMPQKYSDVPAADLLLMKDVLQHLPDHAIIKFAQEVFPKFKFCLLTNSFQKLNTACNVDIKLGGFRCLDLAGPPYSFSGCYVLEFSSALWERIRTFAWAKASGVI